MKKEERSLYRKRQICESAKKLMAQKSLEKITVQEIADECGINRYTFYYHFRDIYDLIAWMFEERTLAHLQKNVDYRTWEDGVRRLLRNIREDRAVYKSVLNSTRLDILHRMFYQEVNPLLRLYLANIIETKRYRVTEEYQNFLGGFFTLAMEGMLLEWINKDLKISDETVIRYLKTILEGQLEDVFRKAEREGFCMKEKVALRHTVVCVGRQSGSGGREIGTRVAEALGVPCYDKRRIAMASVDGDPGRNGAAPGEAGENPWFYGADGTCQEEPFSAVLYRMQSDVIRSVARNGDAVIVGRCADRVLRDMEGIRLLTVYITAPFSFRVDRKTRLERLDREAAEALVKKADALRAQYYRAHTGEEWGRPEGYDLYLDASRYTMEELVAKIVEAAWALRGT